MEGMLGVESWLYTQVRVSDMDRSAAWYSRFLGLDQNNALRFDGPLAEQSTGLKGATIQLTQGVFTGVGLELVLITGEDVSSGRQRIPPFGQLPAFSLAVSDLERCHKMALDNNVYCESRPIHYPSYSSMTIHDPDGIRIELAQVRDNRPAVQSSKGIFPISHWLYTQARVADMDPSLDWYERMLGFRVVNELRLEGPPYEQNTGIPGVRIRMVQGFVGGVQMELIAIQSDDPAAAAKIPPAGNLPAFTVGVQDVDRCYEIAKEQDVYCEGPPASFPPTPYHSLIIHDPDGTRIDLCDFEGPST
jgi:catechol 2,3-dioxygenase-like lactoylglutathione lyase family enzyme